MSIELQLTLKVVASLAFIFFVLWCMWRIKGEPVTDSPAAPILALASTWAGLASVATAIWLWITSQPDIWVVIDVIFWAAAISSGGLAMWVYRHTPPTQMTEPIQMQRMQARVGIGLGLAAVALWYVFILSHKPILTPTG